MNRLQASEQTRITEWFDEIYRRKGERYLRPVKAYYIYLELLEIEHGDSLLDAACGLGLLLTAAREYGCLMHGVDISGTAISKARQNVPDAVLARSNLEQMPFADATFDRLTCIGSLERVLNPRRALAEIGRVVKPNARLCLLVRNSNTMAWRFLSGSIAAKRARGHQGADTLDNWRDLFESTGFEVLRVLPDQYLIHRRKELGSLRLAKVDFRRVVDSLLPLHRANEFIFILKKANSD